MLNLNNLPIDPEASALSALIHESDAPPEAIGKRKRRTKAEVEADKLAKRAPTVAAINDAVNNVYRPNENKPLEPVAVAHPLPATGVAVGVTFNLAGSCYRVAYVNGPVVVFERVNG